MALRVRTSHDKLVAYLLQCPWVFARGDIIDLICDMIPRGHLIEGSCEFLGGSSSRFVITLTSFVTMDIVKVAVCF